MEWAMLASVLAPYIIQAFGGGGGSSGGNSQSPQAQADSDAIRAAMLAQIQGQNQRVGRRENLDADVVSLMESLMPRGNNLIRPGGAGNNPFINPNYPRHVPETPTPGHVYPSDNTGGTTSTNGDGSSQGTRIQLPPSPSMPGGGGDRGGPDVQASGLPAFMFPGWLESLPTYQQTAKARMR